MANMQLIIQSADCPFMAIPREMRLKITDPLVEPSYAHSQFHGICIKPQKQLIYDTYDYYSLAITCKQMHNEMYPLKGKDLYINTTFVFNAFFLGPVSRLGGEIFTLPTFAPMRFIQNLSLDAHITRRLPPYRLRVTMESIPAAINGMPALVSASISVDFAAAPSTAQFSALMSCLAAVRAPGLRVGCALAELIAGNDPLWVLYQRMLEENGAEDVTCYAAYAWDGQGLL